MSRANEMKKQDILVKKANENLMRRQIIQEQHKQAKMKKEDFHRRKIYDT